MAARTPVERRPASRPGGARACTALDRRFEAAVLEWDENGLSDPAAVTIGGLAEELSVLGFDVGVVGTGRIDELDGQLGARPPGPGCLYLVLNQGADVFSVGTDGPELIARDTAGDGVARLLERLRRKGISSHDVLIAGGGLADFPSLLEDQLLRRRTGELPRLESDPGGS